MTNCRRMVLGAMVTVLIALASGCGRDVAGDVTRRTAPSSKPAWCVAIERWADARDDYAAATDDEHLRVVHDRREGMEALAPVEFTSAADSTAQAEAVKAECGQALAVRFHPAYRSIRDLRERFPSLSLPTPSVTVEVPLRVADDLYTLTVAADGCGVKRTERPDGQDAENLTWSVSDADGFEVLGRNALGETAYRYFQGGEYTMVLKGWGGDRYVPVSNTVTIHC